MDEKILKDKNILIGVTGSIAAYKVCDLIREIKKARGNVASILTEKAKWFVTETTLKTLSNGPVLTDMFSCNEEDTLAHIRLSEWADILVIAPATANIIGKMAVGIADDLLSTTALTVSSRIPVLVAPAMNDQMYCNPIVQENISKLQSHGIFFVGPSEGELACGYTGKGRLVDIKDIIEEIKKLLT